MKEFELIGLMMTGDSAAFEKWMEIHAESIERFAIQYGCTPEQAGKLTEGSFRTLHSNLKDLDGDDQPIYNLYKITLEKLSHIQVVAPPLIKIFTFEEDQQLYEEIIALDENPKTSLILAQFHQLNKAEISKILDISEDAVQRAILEAYEQLDGNDSQLEKRLAFLGKSFDRLVILFDKEKVFGNLEEAEKEVVEQKPTLSKKIILTWVAGIVILLALIAVPILTGEEYQNASNEKYAEKLKTSFEKEVAKKFEELGLTEENDWEEEFYTHQIAELPRADFEMMMEDIDRKLLNKEKIDKKRIKKEYDEIIDKLQLPSEMAQQLFKNPLTNDQGKSEEFINEYIEKILHLQNAYFMTYFNHEEIIEATTPDGEIDFEKFYEKNYIYPEDLQLVLDGMKKQNFNHSSVPNWVPFFPEYMNNEFSARIRNSLHENVLGYMALMEIQTRYYSPEQTHTIEESIDYIFEMEKTLLANEKENEAYHALLSTYSGLLYEVVIGSEQYHFFGSDGKLKDAYQKAWEKIASNGEESPSAFIMKKIVDEMNRSDWKESASYSLLDENHFFEALSLARKGNLSSFIFDIESEIANSFLDEQVIENGTLSTSLYEPLFRSTVEKIYEEFSDEHNLALLQGVDPLIIIGVYIHANDMGDPETIWQLFNHEYINISLEDYMKNWTRQGALLEEAENLVIEMGEASINGARHVPVSYEKEGEYYKFSSMLFDNEEGMGIWTIYEIPVE